MLKKLSAEGRFESGIDSLVQGKVYAFISVMSDHKAMPYGLGIAIANEPGYHAVPLTWAHSDSWATMSDYASELNREMSLSAIEEARIVCSTMGGRRVVLQVTDSRVHLA